MTTDRVYLDACCLIEGLKGKLGISSAHDAMEVDAIQRLLRAGRDGALDVFTSMVSVAEVLYVDKDEKPPSDETKRLIERFLLSGRDGIKLVSLQPDTALKARDLAWEHGIYSKSIDMIHVASAIQCKAKELLTLDGRLSKKLDRVEVMGCKLLSAKETKLIPDDYKSDDLFGQKK